MQEIGKLLGEKYSDGDAKEMAKVLRSEQSFTRALGATSRPASTAASSPSIARNNLPAAPRPPSRRISATRCKTTSSSISRRYRWGRWSSSRWTSPTSTRIALSRRHRWGRRACGRWTPPTSTRLALPCCHRQKINVYIMIYKRLAFLFVLG